MRDYVICCNEKGIWEVWQDDELIKSGFETEDEAWEYVDQLDA